MYIEDTEFAHIKKLVKKIAEQTYSISPKKRLAAAITADDLLIAISKAEDAYRYRMKAVQERKALINPFLNMR